MFVINRKKGEQIKIGDTVITILSNQRVKLGVQASKETRVEIVKKVNDEVLQSERQDAPTLGESEPSIVI